MITIKHQRGVGARSHHNVYQDGKHVGWISRFSARTGWEIQSVHYGRTLARSKSLEGARQRALEISYPSVEEEYEISCRQIEAARRAAIERQLAPEIIAASRALLAGSNSAHDTLKALIAKVDDYATNRAANTSAEQWGQRFPTPPETSGSHASAGVAATDET